MKQDSTFTIRINKKVKDDFYHLCEQNSYIASKRIKALMLQDIKGKIKIK